MSLSQLMLIIKSIKLCYRVASWELEGRIFFFYVTHTADCKSFNVSSVTKTSTNHAFIYLNKQLIHSLSHIVCFYYKRLFHHSTV